MKKQAAAISPSLQSFQREFVAALFADKVAVASSPLVQQPGFDVYRNTIMVACVDALAANYPTVSQLVGEEWFRDAASVFVRAHLPRDGSLGSYGEGFGDFLAGFEPARELSYLAGIARLDRCWTEAHLAADAPVLGVPQLGELSPEVLAEARLVVHPAARWARFETMPVFTLWRRHREGLPIGDTLDWVGDGALIVRPHGEVTWQALTPAGDAFLLACSQGQAFGTAMAAAADAVGGDGDPAAWLPALIAAGALSRIEHSDE